MSQDATFVGALGNPYCSPTITRGFVEFTVHPLQGGILRHNHAQLVSSLGEKHPVTVRGTGRVHPGPSSSNRWHPGDFLVRVDGITLEQAQDMREIVQEYIAEGTPFIGDIIEVCLSSAKSSSIEVRVRPQPYHSVALKEAQLITQSGERSTVKLRRIEAAPASPTLGCFGDLLISLEGITLEQAYLAQKLVQEQR